MVLHKANKESRATLACLYRTLHAITHICWQHQLRMCADSLAVPLTDLFNKSMDEGVFPRLWKMSNVSPVYKKAFRYLKENYRPVSLLSCVSKIMERIVYNALYNFFKVNGLLSERNSGFKEKDSTINQLVHLCHQIYQGLDSAKDICLVFF